MQSSGFCFCGCNFSAKKSCEECGLRVSTFLHACRGGAEEGRPLPGNTARKTSARKIFAGTVGAAMAQAGNGAMGKRPAAVLLSSSLASVLTHGLGKEWAAQVRTELASMTLKSPVSCYTAISV